MQIEEIYAMWEVDGNIDQNNISGEAVRVPKIHNKYFRLLMIEGLKLKKLKAEYKEFYKLKTDYYKGDLDSLELQDLGWPPQPLKILRADISTYVESDKDVINMTLKIGLQESIVAYLEDIVKSINTRNFLFRSIIDFEKFRSGIG